MTHKGDDDDATTTVSTTGVVMLSCACRASPVTLLPAPPLLFFSRSLPPSLCRHHTWRTHAVWHATHAPLPTTKRPDSTPPSPLRSSLSLLRKAQRDDMAAPVSSAAPPSVVQLPVLASTGAKRRSRAAAMSGPKPAIKPAAVSPSSSSSPPLHVFADLPDQLLCSPDNSVWVYGQQALSFFSSEAAAQAKLERKVQCMMREAQRHYTISCAFFNSLTSEEQMAEVLRVSGGGGLLPLPPAMSAAAMVTGTPAKRDHRRSGDGSTPVKCCRQRLAGVHRALRDAWPTWGEPDMNGVASSLVSREVGDADDDGSWQNCYSPGLRVNLVLDIVASRKTLGTAPLRSRPYRLAEHLYRLIMQSATTQPRTRSPMLPSNDVPYTTPTTARATPSTTNGAKATTIAAARARSDIAPHVRSLIIGISDAATTLVGLHVVCPYRHLSSPTPTLTRLRRAVEAAADQQRARALSTTATTTTTGLDTHGQGASAAVIAEPAASAPLCCVVASQLARHRRVDALLPAPYVRVPPQSLELIDQTRLILCTPRKLLDGC
ncbi:hypothetical protein MNV84_00357 [Leishmania braziliensis]|nr:hypothetical protein MNV84_00357 [Leishmania braziliensis]